ncbi:MAG: c-type cytochrome biogenesis protein CcmI [Oceanospirillaceae bacterium]|jgi:cytochrome c-type biogenesis protein CcmH|nr:c-type cytochrome biogenesis protein CcmI [Oceanospirillaceae bacterium]MBT4442886.1 c-type cytochrome biogenesis protein CcmI [Oceanospirillaceae bacterium]
MTELWAAIAILLCMASGFVWWALWRPVSAQQDSSKRQQQVISLYKTKRAELEQELAAATVSRSDYDQRLAEMQRTLLLETQAKSTFKAPSGQSQGGLMLVFVALALPIAGLLTYFQLGAHSSLEQRVNMQQTRAITQQVESLPQLIEALNAELKNQPNNPEGWYLLANSYMQNEQTTQGIAAFEQALSKVQIGSGQHAALLGQYAQALFFNDGDFSTRVNQAIAKALGYDPQDVSALSLLGIQAFEAQNYNAAIGFWQRALPRAGEGQGQASLQAGIASAQQMLQQSSDPGVGIAVTVNLVNGLQLPASDHAVLFVYAKQAGRPMPLFATKLDANNLPLNLTLTDAMALQTGTRIGDYQTLDVMAHVALAGVPGRQSGDLVSHSITVVVGSTSKVDLTIDQILK